MRLITPGIVQVNTMQPHRRHLDQVAVTHTQSYHTGWGQKMTFVCGEVSKTDTGKQKQLRFPIGSEGIGFFNLLKDLMLEKLKSENVQSR